LNNVKRAVCVGINDYPGTYNDLSGCVNDANDWAELLKEQFRIEDNIKKLLDKEATKENILKELENLVSSSGPDDIAVFTYSGHGTWVYDQGERDESDNRDEAICARDANIIDDEIREIIRKIDPEAHLTMICDSCHSGSVSRAMLKRTYNMDKELSKEDLKPRYMPPEDNADAVMTELIPIRKRFLYPDSDMKEVLITGCNSTEYSYDAYLGGRFNGIMTAMAIRIIKGDPDLTYKKFHRELREILPSPRYPQSPQLEGNKENKKRKLFS